MIFCSAGGLAVRSFKALREALLELNEVDIAEFWDC